MESTLAGRILLWHKSIPLIGRLACVILVLQRHLWNWKPELAIRLSNFIPIGGLSTLVQLPVFYLLLKAGQSTLAATVAAVELAVLVNYIGNRFITWKDRFECYTPRNKWLSHVLFFLIFQALTPTVWLKIVGINTLFYFGNVNAYLSWFVWTVIGLGLNFVFADEISLGTCVELIARIERRLT